LYHNVFGQFELFTALRHNSGRKAGMAVVGHADANRHALLNTRKLPVYSTCRFCQQTKTLNLLVVVQGQGTMGFAADESGLGAGVQRLKTGNFG
jgi:hypothetical protein